MLPDDVAAATRTRLVPGTCQARARQVPGRCQSQMCDKCGGGRDRRGGGRYVRSMGRQRRVQFPGALYHVTTRGNWRRPIFLDDRDRERFLVLLASVVARQGWICHAYCLMDNHYHLLVTTPAADLADGMHALNGRYARAFLVRHEQSGHVFGRRYHPVLVE